MKVQATTYQRCTVDDCSMLAVNQKYKLCVVHNWERLHPGKSFYDHKRKQKIKPVSDKRKSDNDRYRDARKEFLADHKTCEVEGCRLPAKDVHHKKGRKGFADDWAKENDIPLLIDKRFFLPSCRTHHMFIERNPKWAKEKGYSISRLAKTL